MKINGRMDLLSEAPSGDKKESQLTTPLMVELRIQHGDYTIKVKAFRGDFSKLLAHPRRKDTQPKPMDIPVEVELHQEEEETKKAG